MLYFDNAATTYPKPEQVYKEMDRLTRECAVNSGRGSYKKAENASAVINETRKKVSEFMGGKCGGCDIYILCDRSCKQGFAWIWL